MAEDIRAKIDVRRDHFKETNRKPDEARLGNKHDREKKTEGLQNVVADMRAKLEESEEACEKYLRG